DAQLGVADVDQRPPVLSRGRQPFFIPSSSISSRPICSNNLASRASASAEATLAPLAKIASAPASRCFFQAWIGVGWTSYWPASWLTVRSALWAAKATLALSPAE